MQEGQSDPIREPISALLDTWFAFGSLLGLDADEQRCRHEQDRLRCWWRGCQCKPRKDDTTIKLLQCAGCGEVRYCSKKCQRIDWTAGGHKRMCRRLK
ncbi:hypothetical protein PENSPDRAFT_352254 [Peniophora sp. CONT]|nr:hypothetical protein PENSPDRAFT_352254 [Peniophora sp. CONT]